MLSSTTFANTKEMILKEVEWATREINALEACVTFCHGDMWWGNMLYDQNNGKSSKMLKFIDHLLRTHVIF